MKNTVMILFLSSITSACGVSGATGDAKQFTYLYHQTIDGQPCSTGRKKAKNLEEFCAMLADDDQNRDKKTGVVCAQTLREARLRQDCPDVQRSEIPASPTTNFKPGPQTL